MNKIITPCNPHALPCVHRMMAYLGELSGKGILTGQHTKTRGVEELHHIEQVTGKQPALLGFELLSYSPNINYLDTDEACMEEVANNYGTLRQAWNGRKRRAWLPSPGTGSRLWAAGARPSSPKTRTLTLPARWWTARRKTRRSCRTWT